MPKLFGGPRNKKSRNSSENPEEFRAPLSEHLDELRSRIIRSVLLVSIAWIAGWYIQPWLYEHLNTIVRSSVERPGVEYKEAFRSATDPFMLKFKLSFMIGLGLAFPFIVLQIWGFVAPGLKPGEKKPLRKMAPLSVLLFAIGAGFCWLILPQAFKWFGSYLSDFPGTSLFQEPGSMVFFILKMMVAFGAGFQLPLIVFFLGKIGLLTPETLSEHWRQATVFIFFASAVITPSNDAFSMLMMAVPLSLLFIISIWAVRLTTRHRPEDEYDAVGDEEAEEVLSGAE